MMSSSKVVIDLYHASGAWADYESTQPHVDNGARKIIIAGETGLDHDND